MSESTSIDEGRKLLSRFAEIASKLPDESIPDLVGDGGLEAFLTAIFDPRRAREYPSIAEFFLAHKHRSATMAGVRKAITRACAIQGTTRGITGFVSPMDAQWFDDGVMVLEGRAPFEGLICKYENGRLSYGVAARDAEAGESLGRDAFRFVDIDEVENHFDRRSPPEPHELELPIKEMEALLQSNDPDEAKVSRASVAVSVGAWIAVLIHSKA